MPFTSSRRRRIASCKTSPLRPRGDLFTRNMEKMNILMRSRTPQELIAAQSDLLRDNLEGILQSSRRVAEASVGVTDETMRRVTEVMGKQRRAA